MTIKLTPRLCRAARSLVGWSQHDLAAASGVSRATLSGFEPKDESAALGTLSNSALVQAFERAGLQFIEKNGGGAGVRLANAD